MYCYLQHWGTGLMNSTMKIKSRRNMSQWRWENIITKLCLWLLLFLHIDSVQPVKRQRRFEFKIKFWVIIWGGKHLLLIYWKVWWGSFTTQVVYSSSKQLMSSISERKSYWNGHRTVLQSRGFLLLSWWPLIESQTLIKKTELCVSQHHLKSLIFLQGS